MSLEFAIFLKHVQKKKKKIARQMFSQNSHRVVAGVSNPSQFSLRESESARNVRQLCEGLATYETKL